VEAELWDAADTAAASGDAGPRATAVRASWPLVDAALSKLAV
jgi:hypothetical protein